jgi:hypothetical protein
VRVVHYRPLFPVGLDLASSRSRPARFSSLNAMQKFEYATLVADSAGLLSSKLDHKDFHQRLNAYGAEGWELVNILSWTNNGDTREVTAVFKRPLA